MKTSPLKQTGNESHLKLIRSNRSNKKNLKTKIKRIYINTLIPSFEYMNHLNKLVTRKNCALI